MEATAEILRTVPALKLVERPLKVEQNMKHDFLVGNHLATFEVRSSPKSSAS